ncbi:MAG: hypothetical protein ACOC7T_05855 [Planctomycetota bacterium]
MEYTALFVWLTLCLILGATIRSVMAGALTHRPVQFVAAPGLFIRKFSMSLTALACGATLTRARVYDLSERDVDFEADGAGSVAKVLVPLAPLFGCATAMVALNAMFGRPLHLDYSPPGLDSLDAGGVQEFVAGTWSILAQVVRRGARADWGNPRLYVLFGLTFSLSIGASTELSRAREAVLGAGLLAVGLALFCSLSLRGFRGGDPLAWPAEVREFVVRYSAVAFVMMVYGMLTALVVGMIVRVYEMAGSGSGSGKTRGLPSGKSSKRAA